MFYYEIVNDKNARLVNYEGNIKDGYFIIPEKVDDYIVTEIAPYTFADREDLISVYIPKSIKVLGEGCFARCKNLKFVFIDAFAEKIPQFALLDCESLMGLFVNSKIKKIENYAFANCISLACIYTDTHNTAFVIGKFNKYFNTDKIQYMNMKKEIANAKKKKTEQNQITEK